MTLIRQDSTQTGIGFTKSAGPGQSVVRTDAKTFRLIAAARPVFYHLGTSPTTQRMFSIGFWYAREPRGDLTSTVVVILREPPWNLRDIMRHVGIVADKLAEKLANNDRLAALHEFDRSRLALKAV